MTDAASLAETHTWTGYWWLPDYPDEKVPGVLTYAPDDTMRLDLVGGWRDRSSELAPGVKAQLGASEWPVIFGVGNAKLITLLDSFGSGTYRFGGVALAPFDVPATTVVTTNSILIGCHLPSRDEPAFESAEVTIEHLTWWAKNSGLAWSRGPRGGRDEITLEPVEPAIADVGTTRMKLTTLQWSPHVEVTRTQRTARFKEHSSVFFESDKPGTLDDWTKLMSAIRDLVSLAALTPSACLTTRVFLPPDPERYSPEHPLRNYPIEVHVFERAAVRPSADSEVDVLDPIFTTADLPFEQAVPRWFDMRERFGAATGIVLGLLADRGGYVETRVITAVVAAEAFHRALAHDPPLERERYKALLKAIRAAVSDEDRAFLNDRIPHNEVTLRERLLAVWAMGGSPSTALLPNPAKWVKAAKDARNALAHTGSTPHQQGDELYAVAEVTTALVVLGLLRELGVPEDVVSKAVTSNRFLRQAAHSVREWFTD